MHVFNLKLNRLADEVGASETFISRSSEIPQEPAARAASPQLSAGVPPEQTITIGTPPTPPKRQSLGSRLARRN
jgi:hypothetical protein